MSSEWPLVPVEEVCELIVDCVNKTAPVVPYETPYRMIRTTNIRDGRISLESCRFVEKDTYEKWTRRAKLQYGDVLLTREAPIGEVGFVDAPEGVFLGQRIMQYRANSRVLHPRFLHYVFQSPSLKHQFGSHEGSGSVVSHIRVGDCFKFKIPLPPRAVQEGVAELLGALDDRITLLRETNATLEAIAQALFKSWFVDFDPVRAKAEGRQPEGMDATTATLFPDSFEESELGLVPRGWKIVSLGSQCSLEWGNTTITKKSYVVNGVKAYSAAGQDGFVEKAERSGIGSVISAIGTVGNVHLAFEDWTAIKNTLTAQCDSDEESSYIHFLLGNVSFPSRGSTQQFISLGDARGLKVISPPIDAKLAFGDIALYLIRKIVENQKQAQTLTQLRDTLLPRLISGQLRLPEAEALVEEACA